MKIVKAEASIITPIDGRKAVKLCEICGRTCYKSEDKATEGSAEDFMRMIIKRGHESVLEHYGFSVRFIVDRGVSHEIVRHRLASICQESSRYCNYSDGRFDGEITVIEPCYLQPGTELYNTWRGACKAAEKAYFDLLNAGCTAQEARAVLPMSLKTELVMTANLREWRHFLRLRTSGAAHPQMREVALPLLYRLQRTIPVVFDEIGRA